MSVDKSRPLEDILDVSLLFKNNFRTEKGFFGGRTYIFQLDKNKFAKYNLDQILQIIKRVGNERPGEKIAVIENYETTFKYDPHLAGPRTRKIYDILKEIKLNELRLKKVPTHEIDATPFKQTVYKVIRFIKNFFSKNYLKKVDSLEKDLIPQTTRGFIFLQDSKLLKKFNKTLTEEGSYPALESAATKIYDYPTAKKIIDNLQNLYDHQKMEEFLGLISGYKSTEGALESLLLAALNYANNRRDNQLKQSVLTLLLPNLANSSLIQDAFRDGFINLDSYPPLTSSKLDEITKQLKETILSASLDRNELPKDSSAKLGRAFGILEYIQENGLKLEAEQLQSINEGISINNMNLTYPNSADIYASMSDLSAAQLEELIKELDKEEKTLEGLYLVFYYLKPNNKSVLSSIFNQIKDHKAIQAGIREGLIKQPPK